MRLLQLLLVVSALGGLLAWQLSQPVDGDDAGTAPAVGVERTTDPVAAPSAAKPAEAASEVPALAPPEPEQPSLMVDTARVVAHRVSPAERAEYRRRIEQSADLKGAEQDLLRRAATGEADAAAALADLYAFCAQALTQPRTPRAPKPGKPPPPPTPAERCAAYGAPGALTALNLRSTARAWRRTAAELGDTVSQLIGDESFARPGTAAARERQRAAEALLRNGDYQGLLENMGYLIPISVLSQGDAWRPVLCSLVPNCESESCRMQCPADYLATSLRRLAPREQRVRMGQQAALLQAIRSGSFDELWDPGTGP